MARTQEEAVLTSVADRFVAAWNAHDMQAFAGLFAEDTDFVNVIGLWWKGRWEIQQQHELLHATRMKNTQLTSTGMSIRTLGADHAIIYNTWELRGDEGTEGWQMREVRKGILVHVLRARSSASEGRLVDRLITEHGDCPLAECLTVEVRRRG